MQMPNRSGEALDDCSFPTGPARARFERRLQATELLPLVVMVLAGRDQGRIS